MSDFRSKFKFKKEYLLLTLLLFLIEVLIALFMHDPIIRPYIGDFLVVILIYCFLKTFLNAPVFPLAISVLLLSYFIEIGQYFNLVKHLGLQEYKVARIVIGVSFEWIDMLAYTLGITTVIGLESYATKRRLQQTVQK